MGVFLTMMLMLPQLRIAAMCLCGSAAPASLSAASAVFRSLSSALGGGSTNMLRLSTPSGLRCERYCPKASTVSM